MKRASFILFGLSIVFASCTDPRREQELQRKERALNEKEQVLLQKEKSLQIKEEELIRMKLRLDSTLNKVPKDTGVYNPDLEGRWSVTMNCTETTCPGSAVGDTKTEQWDIAHENNRLIAKAFDNGKLVRMYSGLYNGSTLELTVNQNEKIPEQATTIVVKVQQSSKNKLEGTREIIRAENCKILYAVQFVKK